MSSARRGIARGFRDVDAGGAEDFGAYLRRVAQEMAAEKAASLELVEPASGRRILDVGCGVGDDARALASRVMPGGTVVGVDRSTTLIEEARRHGSPAGVDFIVADADALPFDDVTFDAARTERVLQHVEDPAAALAEMARVVTAGGIVVACEPDWGTLVVDASDRQMTREVVRTLCDEHILNGWIGRQLVGHFRRLSFQQIEVWPVTLAVRSLALASDLLHLEQAAGTGWFEELQRSDSEGAFFAAITGFMVKGRRPHHVERDRRAPRRRDESR